LDIWELEFRICFGFRYLSATAFGDGGFGFRIWGCLSSPSVLPKNLRVFVELFAKKISPKIVSAYWIWSKEFEKNFIFDKSA
jgi:hypothetical protein